MTAVSVDRARTIGGTDVAGIMGISPFRTKLDVWREKVLGQRDGIDNAATRAGLRFESHVLDAYRRKFLPEGSKLWTPDQFVDGYRRATPDAVAEVAGWRRLVEVKTTALGGEWGETNTDEVPLHYAVQGTWYLDLLELEEADYPVLAWPWEKRDLLGLTPAEIVEAVDLRVLKVAYSPSLAKRMRDAVTEFWDRYVLPEEPPPAVDLEDQKRLVRVVMGKHVPLDDELVSLLVLRDKIKAEAKEIKAREDANTFAIRNKLGDAEYAVLPNAFPAVTLKAVSKASHVVKATTYRELRLTKHWTELQKKETP